MRARFIPAWGVGRGGRIRARVVGGVHLRIFPKFSRDGAQNFPRIF